MAKELAMEVNGQKDNVKPVRNAGIFAGIGATILGGKELIRQKQILSKPDVFIKNAEAAANKAKEFKTPFFVGSKEASDMAIKQIDDKLAALKKFATGGKLNLKSIAKKGLIGAGIGLAIVAGCKLLKKLFIKTTIEGMKLERDIITNSEFKQLATEIGVEGKKIERDIVVNPQANQAISDIRQATGAQNVQFV